LGVILVIFVFFVVFVFFAHRRRPVRRVCA
jgi:hypothetical protein